LRPFAVSVPDADLSDLRTRLAATRWIEDIFDGDWRFGAPLPFVRELCAYWRDGFDWRAMETRINREPQIKTEIDGLAVHTVHRRSAREDAIPIILLHGWPGSYLEFLDLYEPLAAPAPDEPAFHVVTPSLPGYGFSATRPGTGPREIARLFVTLMERLGYPRFMVQGGDWGSLIGTEIARQFPERVIGLHLNLVNGSPPPDADKIALSTLEQSWIANFGEWMGFPHIVLNSQKPASLAYALNDSPAGLAAWIGEKICDWGDKDEAGQSLIPRDRMLANIALYWFTRTSGSAARLYYETFNNFPEARFVGVPTAGAIFPQEQVKIPRAWAERHYNIVQWTLHDRGGHFPAMEVPDALIADIRRFAGLTKTHGEAIA